MSAASPPPDLRLRPGTTDDLPSLTDLYNHYVAETAITFDTEPFTTESRTEWFSHYATRGRHRLIVAESGGGIVGYATSSPFRPKAAYITTVEVSVYCRPDAVGRGIGSMLYERLFAELAAEDVHRAIAGITLPNERSIALHHRFGFTEIGVEHEVGRKFDRYWDVLLLERPVGA